MSVEWRLSVDCVQIAVAWAHTKAAFCANADGVGNGRQRQGQRRRQRRRCCCCCWESGSSRANITTTVGQTEEQLDSLATRIVGHKAKPSQESKQADSARGANSPLKEIKRENPYTHSQGGEAGAGPGAGAGVCPARSQLRSISHSSCHLSRIIANAAHQ